jgi:hypothetical protein
LRLSLVRGGLPTPEVRYRIVDEHGFTLARPDLAYPAANQRGVQLGVGDGAPAAGSPAGGPTLEPFVGLLAASQHDPVLAEAMHAWLLTARRRGDRCAVRLYYRLLVGHEPLSPEYARTVVDTVFPGLCAAALA